MHINRVLNFSIQFFFLIDFYLGEAAKLVTFTAWVVNDEYSSKDSIIAFQSTILNKGDAFQTSTGVFTAPYHGIYFFLADLNVSGDYGKV